MGVDRLERVNSLLKRVIAESMFTVMRGDLVPPSSITVTGVSCGRDLHDAVVSVSIFGDENLKTIAMRQLRSRARRFQEIIAREVKLKFTPKLAFRLDRSIEKGDEVLAILDSLPQS
ncbi:MAG: 30S ribosome-binding factor RbfA [Kiritimatiellae bacterium]|mgnify:CR=1 FL=1|nr:30S ribosome-binding factor RbfA [Kiritimatiellia bacterium]